MYAAFKDSRALIESERYFLIEQIDKVRDGRVSRNDHDAIGPPDLVKKLVNILVSRRGLGVQDPRDMIFAHIGIAGLDDSNAKHPLLRPLVVDYIKTKKEVYEGLAAVVFAEGKIYDFLRNAESTVCLEDRTSNLATWAPDWANNSERPLRSLCNSSISFRLQGRGKLVERGVKHTLCEPFSILACIGRKICRIKRISAELSTFDYYGTRAKEEENPDNTVFNQWRRWLLPITLRWGRLPSLQAEGDFLSNQLRKLSNDSRHEFKMLLHGRRLAQLDTGEGALVPAISRPGDTICIFRGHTMPFVIRMFGESDEHATAVYKHLVSKREWKNHMSTISHCYFLGESVVEILPNFEDEDTMVFALH